MTTGSSEDSGSGRSLSRLVLPARISTQSWMTLTFTVFVGISVLAIGLYAGIIVRSEVQVTIRQTLFQQTSRIAGLVEEAKAGGEAEEVIREIARLTDLRLTVIDATGEVIDFDGVIAVRDDALAQRPELQNLTSGQANYDRREENGQQTLFAAVERPETGLVVRIGQLQPRLITLLERMQIALVIAMAMTLCMTILGSWIAARRVTEPLQEIGRRARVSGPGIEPGKIYLSPRIQQVLYRAEVAENAHRGTPLSLNHFAHVAKGMS